MGPQHALTRRIAAYEQSDSAAARRGDCYRRARELTRIRLCRVFDGVRARTSNECVEFSGARLLSRQ